MANGSDPKTQDSIDAPATMESWDELMEFIAQQSEQHLTDAKQIYGMRLAGEEILSNMIRETQRPSDKPSDVHIWITSRLLHQAGNAWFELLLEDNGPVFDPNLDQPREIQLNTPINERPIGGLGLFLVQNSCDDASYEWSNNRNCYHLKMQLSGR